MYAQKRCRKTGNSVHNPRYHTPPTGSQLTDHAVPKPQVWHEICGLNGCARVIRQDKIQTKTNEAKPSRLRYRDHHAQPCHRRHQRPAPCRSLADRLSTSRPGFARSSTSTTQGCLRLHRTDGGGGCLERESGLAQKATPLWSTDTLPRTHVGDIVAADPLYRSTVKPA